MIRSLESEIGFPLLVKSRNGVEFIQNNYPDVVFDITECSQNDMVEGIRNGSMDLALMSSQNTYVVFKKAGITPAAKYFSKDCVAILSMVKHGVGVSVLPALILQQFPGEYEYRLLDPPVNRTLGIGVRDRKNCGPLARFIIRFIREQI